MKNALPHVSPSNERSAGGHDVDSGLKEPNIAARLGDNRRGGVGRHDVNGHGCRLQERETTPENLNVRTARRRHDRKKVRRTTFLDGPSRSVGIRFVKKHVTRKDIVGAPEFVPDLSNSAVAMLRPKSLKAGSAANVKFALTPGKAGKIHV